MFAKWLLTFVKIPLVFSEKLLWNWRQKRVHYLYRFIQVGKNDLQGEVLDSKYLRSVSLILQICVKMVCDF